MYDLPLNDSNLFHDCCKIFKESFDNSSESQIICYILSQKVKIMNFNFQFIRLTLLFQIIHSSNFGQVEAQMLVSVLKTLFESDQFWMIALGDGQGKWNFERSWNAEVRFEGTMVCTFLEV